MSYIKKRKIVDYHGKILKEVLEIFHFITDIRQDYLMIYCPEALFSSIYKKIDEGLINTSDTDHLQKMVDNMIESNVKILTKHFRSEFANDYRVYAVDEMHSMIFYGRNIEKLFRKGIRGEHKEFNVLLMNTFNTSIMNKDLQHSVLTLMARIYSEKAELVRNLDKVLLACNKKEWDFYNWTASTIKDLSEYMETSSLWLKDQHQKEGDEYIALTTKALDNLLKPLYYEFEIDDDDDKGSLNIEFVDDAPKILNKYVQKVYRNLKLYNHLILFLKTDKDMLIEVRKSTETNDRIDHIKKIFRTCFQILIGMSTNCPETQNILWKYKEFFVFPSLGSIIEDGELQLVLAIFDNKEKFLSAKSTDKLFEKTRQRID